MLPALQRALGLVLLLVPVVALAGPDRELDLDDVLRLHAAGVSEDIIISEIIVTESAFRLSVDDILRFQEAGVSERLLQFLIDTARDQEPAADAGEETGEDAALYAEDTPYYDEWVNEIEELEPTTTYHVSLNYSYSTWWYDCYWYDYWYWDFHYYPYSSSWVTHLGAWYPAWYGYRTCWAPAYWGYRSWYYDHWDYPWWAGTRYCSAGDPFYYAGYRSGYGGPGLSQTKTKTGSGSAGLPVYVDAGLKLPDGGRLHIRDTKAPVDLRDKPRDGRLVATDHPGRPDGKTPVRGPSDEVKAPDGGGGRKPVAPDRGALGSPEPVRTPTPVRDVRSPATGGRPVKVRTLSDPSGEVADPPSRGDTPVRFPVRPAPAEPPARDDSSQPPTKPTTPPGTPTPSVKPPPTPAPAPKTPQVAPSPPPRSVRPAPAPAPAPKSSPPSRSSSPSPGRSKGAPSPPKGRG